MSKPYGYFAFLQWIALPVSATDAEPSERLAAGGRGARGRLREPGGDEEEKA
jgi:hypothetical protein